MLYAIMQEAFVLELFFCKIWQKWMEKYCTKKTFRGPVVRPSVINYAIMEQKWVLSFQAILFWRVQKKIFTSSLVYGPYSSSTKIWFQGNWDMLFF